MCYSVDTESSAMLALTENKPCLTRYRDNYLGIILGLLGCGALAISPRAYALTAVPGQGRIVLAESSWTTPEPTLSNTIGPFYLPAWFNVIGPGSYNPPPGSGFAWSSDNLAFGYKVADDVILGLTGRLTVNYAEMKQGPLTQIQATYNHDGSAGNIAPSTWTFYGTWSVRRSIGSYEPPTDNINTFTGSVWLYVGPKALLNAALTVPEVYFGRRMSSSTSGYSGLWLTQSTPLSITPPGCTIGTATSIEFDTSLGEEAMHQVAPLTITCGNSNLGRDFALQLKGQPVAPSLLSSPSVISLQNPDGQTEGGRIRGFVGESAIGDAGCQDKSTSISFDGSARGFAVLKSGSVGLSPIPLVWVLCKSGTEQAGVAKGAVTLELLFK